MSRYSEYMAGVWPHTEDYMNGIFGTAQPDFSEEECIFYQFYDRHCYDRQRLSKDLLKSLYALWLPIRQKRMDWVLYMKPNHQKAFGRYRRKYGN